jgi:hypothetical protein
LAEIVDGYLAYMEQSLKEPKPEGMLAVPADLASRNKYRIVFGNVRDLLDYHTKIILPEIERSVGNASVLSALFSGRRDSLKSKYGRFCLNKPKSEYVITEQSEYFCQIRIAKNFRHSLNSQLMAPIQRVTRYPLILRDIGIMYSKAGALEEHCAVMRAYEIANEVAEYANNMMTAGRIRSFPGEVTRQGAASPLCQKKIY